MWWADSTVLHAVFGNLWGVLSPWPALHALLTAPPPLRWLRERSLFSYPGWLGCWPAVFGLAAFAWLELVYPAPQDPARLAAVVSRADAVPECWSVVMRVTLVAAATRLVPATLQPVVSTSKPGFPTSSVPGAATVHSRSAGVGSTLEEPSTATTWKVCAAAVRAV